MEQSEKEERPEHRDSLVQNPKQALVFDKKPYLNLMLTVVLILLVSFMVTLVNQVSQLVFLASQVHPVFGQCLLWFFILLALATIIWTIVLLASLEKPLPLPDENDPTARTRYLAKLKKRLDNNRFLRTSGFEWTPDKPDEESIQSALQVLDDESLSIIRRQATTVFVTTAVSQNGSLDSLFVFVTAFKLVWQITLLYHQRPSIRDLAKLYTNVFATVLLTRQIDDLDLIAEQLEPALTTLFGGSVSTLVPGASYVVSFVADSIFEGSLNALLMLRIGFIAQQYCHSTTRAEPRTISRSASVQALKLLGTIVSENSLRISHAILKAVKNASVHSFQQGKGKVTGVMGRLFRRGEQDPYGK
ncbi:MAG: DUF697 domain-containing protein [Eubacteriales bacterium]|nr:DUF697 domain-containing protein [Eubacteriales bacterium]